MFFEALIHGDLLPPGAIALTYDDGPDVTESAGPGPRTLDLASYLADEGVSAAFFVIGERARALPNVIEAVHAKGHIVASHGETHRNLMRFHRAGGDAAKEVVTTDTLVREITGAETTFYRPPYGAWADALHGASGLAATLNATPGLSRCVGPIGWDIAAQDWNAWSSGRSAAECARECFRAINQRKSGIILLHDSAWERVGRAGNRSLELTRILVPQLRSLGYRFVRLDEIPQAITATLVTQRVALSTMEGAYVTCADGVTVRLGHSSLRGANEELGMISLDGDLVAFRASNGRLLSLDRTHGDLSANADTIDAASRFALVPVGEGRVALRSADYYVAATEAGNLRARAQTALEAQRFRLQTL
jgi:peptidoglycan/xylan/chitin deacetylase (PgdA/CDA1 family)